jgi:hypothetical protein
MMQREGRDPRALALRVLTFLGGLYFFLYFITPESLIEQTSIKAAHESISNGFIAVGSMAIGLGIINILAAHGLKLIFAKKGWQFSLALLVGMFVMIGVTIAHWITTDRLSADIRRVQVIGDFAGRIVEDARSEPGRYKSFAPTGVLPPLQARVAALDQYGIETTQYLNLSGTSFTGDLALQELQSECVEGAKTLTDLLIKLRMRSWNNLDQEGEALLTSVSQQAARVASTYAIVRRKESARWLSSRLYDFLYNGLFNHLGASMFALLGVYIAAAAYRAFRIQSVESALMMTAALVVMLGQISFGKMLYSEMPAIRQWLLEVPNSAAFRAIRLGAGVAGLMLSIRMWLSIESRKGGGHK